MGHVFISYSRSDHAYVQNLAAYLSTAGIEVWYDYEITAGDTFGPRIQQAIDECVAFVVVLSPSAVASKWVVRETGYADSLNKPILPLLLATCDKPIEVSQIQHEDVRGAVLPPRRFVDTLRALSGAGPEPSATPPLGPMPVRNDRRPALAWLLIGLGVCGLLISFSAQRYSAFADLIGAHSSQRNGVSIVLLVVGSAMVISGCVLIRRWWPLAVLAPVALGAVTGLGSSLTLLIGIPVALVALVMGLRRKTSRAMPDRS